MDQGDIATVLDQLHPRLVLPMHYFSEHTLRRFTEKVQDRYEIVFSRDRTVAISRATLPTRPQVLVLPGPLF